ncbi:hypothetical protein [Pseudoteredinibacter isoporae]|uniref:Uncharacterized protein n=1 Tax=Pseudoteredinibacter isoporae TaxID=570281 RepID=A0A7X0JX80_9GAMM|nr:hypothetical protein [Pseudoteredinibacter isoporae]MBB6523180.1 hypothetical protein [Pseudoteredinibacter isoporae]NHO88698.1 hypothetical protein [Pseudoteredinibacter isoporae]NIB22611.1 hypothetical protein [Pseudoteredinibacter isoporae]
MSVKSSKLFSSLRTIHPVDEKQNKPKNLGLLITLFFMLSLCTFLIASSSQSQAQATITVGGTDFESLSWPAGSGFESSISGNWTGNGGGSITLTAEFFAQSDSGPASFTDPIFSGNGITLNNVSEFRANMGQHNNKESQAADQQTISNQYTLNSGSLPTELYFLLGGDDNNGHKYTVQTWSSTQTGTTFELIQGTPTIVDITGNNSATLSYKNYDSSNNGNNRAKVLIKVRNPNGISQFESLSNRIDDNGDPFDFSPGASSADFSGSTILVRVTPSAPPSESGHSHSVPTMNPLILAILGLSVLTLIRRKGYL